MLEDLRGWEETLPAQNQSALEEGISWIRSRSPEEKATIKPVKKNPLFPMKLEGEIEEGASVGKLKLEVLMGRSLWLGITRGILTDSSSLNTLLQHKWTILHPAEGLSWFTSDCPIIRLNYYKRSHYDFKGGWGNKGSEILFPLSPNHLMYTKVGDRRPWARGTKAPLWFTKSVRQMIAENAYRYVFAVEEDASVSAFRPRTIDKKRFQEEKAYWKNWHEQNSKAELEYL